MYILSFFSFFFFSCIFSEYSREKVFCLSLSKKRNNWTLVDSAVRDGTGTKRWKYCTTANSKFCLIFFIVSILSFFYPPPLLHVWVCLSKTQYCHIFVRIYEYDLFRCGGEVQQASVGRKNDSVRPGHLYPGFVVFLQFLLLSLLSSCMKFSRRQTAMQPTKVLRIY